MKTLFLHIGMEKTGTTSIQTALGDSSSELRSRKVIYLNSLGGFRPQSIADIFVNNKKENMFRKLQKLDSAEKIAICHENVKQWLDESIKNDLSKMDKWILSSEHFQSQLTSIEEIQQVKVFFSHYFDRIHIICYLREQGSACLSRYSTAVKSGHSAGFDEFVKSCNSQSHFYNYDLMIGKWENVFGRKNVSLRIFDAETRESLLNDFMSTIDHKFKFKLNSSSKQSNKSLSKNGILLIRLVNQLIKNDNEIAILRTIRKGMVFFIASFCSGKDMSLMSRDHAQAIQQQFEESNNVVREKYFPNKEFLFSNTGLLK